MLRADHEVTVLQRLGLPVPEIYVLDNERGINAFAAGHTQSDVTIGVTRGCLRESQVRAERPGRRMRRLEGPKREGGAYGSPESARRVCCSARPSGRRPSASAKGSLSGLEGKRAGYPRRRAGFK